MFLTDLRLPGVAFALLWIPFIWVCCQTEMQASGEKHLIYLHGRIVEQQGPEAVHPTFGPYRYYEIIDSLMTTGALVHHEIRTSETDFYSFATKTSNLIDSLLRSGARPSDITVVGASKGAVMAMQIAHQNTAPVRYVLLGANNATLEEQQDWNLHGHILAIYETSDQLAGRSYDQWIERSTRASSFRQLPIHTGLGHGFLYRPHPAWLLPVKEWITTEIK